LKHFFKYLFCLGILLQVNLIYSQEKPAIEKSQRIEQIEGNDYYIHTVGKGQTLYSISKTYNVDLTLINSANPELKEGLKAGMQLRIPIVKETVESPKKETETKEIKEKKETTEIKHDTIPPKPTVNCISEQHKDLFNIALFVPFYLYELDSVKYDDPEQAKHSAGSRPLRFLQFYEGLLLAADSLKNLGMSIKLHVYDVDEDTVKTKKILKAPELAKMDLFIGLTYGNTFIILSNFSRQKNIPIVNPLSNKKQNIEGNTKAFLANPTVKAMANSMCEFLFNKYIGERILLVSSNKENEKKTLKVISQGFADLKQVEKKGPEIIDTSIGNEVTNLSEILSKSKENVILLFSNDELFVAEYIRKLLLLSDAYPLTLFGMPGWADFKSVESSALLKLKYHSFSASFIDYQQPTVRDFLFKFREKYKTEPLDFAFQGYDIGMYFLTSLFYYGKDFYKCSESHQQKALQTTFIFKTDGKDGFENTWLNIYRYQDYKMIDARH
jgi:hypothetical protein